MLRLFWDAGLGEPVVPLASQRSPASLPMRSSQDLSRTTTTGQGACCAT